jgi:hypothetical protein
VRGIALVSVVGLAVLLACGCGSGASGATGSSTSVTTGSGTSVTTGSSTTATTGSGSSGTVRVTGEVARSCVGPLVVGRPRQCSELAVFERGGKKVTVRGKFSVELSPGTYRVSVDTCMDQETLTIRTAITGLMLVPRCAVPL